MAWPPAWQGHWGTQERGTGAEDLSIPECDKKGVPVISSSQWQAALFIVVGTGTGLRAQTQGEAVRCLLTRGLCTSWAPKGESLLAWGPDPRLLAPGKRSSFQVSLPLTITSADQIPGPVPELGGPAACPPPSPAPGHAPRPTVRHHSSEGKTGPGAGDVGSRGRGLQGTVGPREAGTILPDP